MIDFGKMCKGCNRMKFPSSSQTVKSSKFAVRNKVSPTSARGNNGADSGFPVPGFFTPRMDGQVVEGSFKATGKTVVITGGSQGIGRAAALLFAKKGFNVVVAARDLTKLQYVAHDCAQAAGRQGASMAVKCDVTNEREVKDLATAVLSKYENVDVVINNAGIMTRGRFEDTPVLEAKKLLEVNYLGSYMVTQTFLPIMIKENQRKKSADKPSIIMVGSFASKVPLKYMSAFTASKYALAGFTDAIRAEVAPLGVHVGQVHPGLVKSNFMERAEFYGKDSVEERKSFRQLVRSLPFSQTPQEVADAIYNAYMTKSDQVLVGLPFAAADTAFWLTRTNISALPLINQFF
ncbi:hypothetical protein CEUSTIGMA_g9860.t1 [Chlamydomonas eustigma]|uniref:Uncharacterized protein n=1 Tax=Chlamydomonas eustigma TaxID=1157962 RepID=A0A250XHM8_9CHLO|nr:hypothetical protein CEUSTIGMA_g9860.t1 [Chlamydomonas eustigma]|eukprot:GAX82432.1 hypothetical protein CEUSTIGMA_g9860.t1 [Chlamydomonas eustigma]